MSVRVYQLAKDLGLESKEILRLLQERGLKVASVSSSIPSIYANAIIEELGSKPKDISTFVQNSSLKILPNEEVSTIPTEATKLTDGNLKASGKPSSMTVSLEKIENAGEMATPSPDPNMAALVNTPNMPPLPKAIKIPLPKSAPKTPMAFVQKDPVNVSVSEASIKGEVLGLDEPKGTTEVSVEAQSNFPENKSAHRPKTETEVIGVRKKMPATNFNERRPAPTVRFPFTTKNPLNNDSSNASKAPIISRENEGAVPKALICKAPLIVRDFAQAIGIKPFQLISKLMQQGIFASMGQQITDDVAISIAAQYGFKLEIRQKQDPTKQNQPKIKIEVKKELLSRPPVICVLGHVDHGKTTLLDTIRHTRVAAGEVGGITQCVSVYQIDHNGQKITFLDTPGHAAFSNMRERGANVTDIAILVVAADDGFMPQTDEALQFAQKAGISVVVAINKIDAKGANIDRVKQQMQQRGIAPEEWGGETLCVGISALKETNIDELLLLVLLQAEIMELKADYKCPASGIVIESQIDVGRGPTATAIVKSGTLKVGDALVCGESYCRVRSMLNERSESIKATMPSMAVKIIGWNTIPNVGDVFEKVQDEKTAKKQAEEYAESNRKNRQIESSSGITNAKTLFEAIASQNQKVLSIILKCDVHGVLEVMMGCLNAIKSDKVKLEILNSGVGSISKNDIELAHSSGSTVVGFNVKTDNGVVSLAKNKSVLILSHDIIYELIDQVKEKMAELLGYEYTENHLGTADVRKIFNLAKMVIAGCMVIDGKIMRDKSARVHRNNKVIFEGKIDSLKREKEDLSESRSGFECGIRMAGFSAFEIGDHIECFEMISHRQKL